MGFIVLQRLFFGYHWSAKSTDNKSAVKGSHYVRHIAVLNQFFGFWKPMPYVVHPNAKLKILRMNGSLESPLVRTFRFPIMTPPTRSIPARAPLHVKSILFRNSRQIYDAIKNSMWQKKIGPKKGPALSPLNTNLTKN